MSSQSATGPSSLPHSLLTVRLVWQEKNCGLAGSVQHSLSSLEEKSIMERSWESVISFATSVVAFARRSLQARGWSEWPSGTLTIRELQNLRQSLC